MRVITKNELVFQKNAFLVNLGQNFVFYSLDLRFFAETKSKKENQKTLTL